jgi:hypothetical protein
MTDITCPSCDAPAPARARRCERCGYRFVEEGTPAPRPRPGRAAVAGVAALVVVAGAAIVAGRGGEEGETAPRGDAARARLEVLSDRPLARRAAERLLEARFVSVADDDGADVRCSDREPRPAHSVRRCQVIYPNGQEGTIVLLTNANGAEVMSEP